MQVDIWSDVRCPFCYIGKRKFEAALEKFPQKSEVKVIWHSFELDPGVWTQPETNFYDFFSKYKQISKEQAVEMNNRVTEIGKQIGLIFNIENSVIANSFNAHRLIQLAKTKNLGSEAKEQLFKAHFTDSLNIDDPEVLIQTGLTIGLEEGEVKAMLSSGSYADPVKQDELQAQSLGIRAVPYFVFNNKYGVSGAQETETFLKVLEEVWAETGKESGLST